MRRANIKHFLVFLALLATGCGAGSGGGGGGGDTSAPTGGSGGGSSGNSSSCTRVSYSQQILKLAPVGYWRLDDTGTTAVDLSGSSNGGTYVNGVTQSITGAITGDSNNAVSFSGNNQYVNIPYSTSLNSGTVKTVVSWVKMTVGNSVSFSVGDTTTNTYQVWVNPTGLAALWSNNMELDGPSVIDGNWHMLVGVWDGTNASIYVDGSLGATKAMVIPSTVSTFNNQIGAQCAGANSTNCDYMTTGSIDDVSVFNSALTATQIQTLYSASSIAPCP